MLDQPTSPLLPSGDFFHRNCRSRFQRDKYSLGVGWTMTPSQRAWNSTTPVVGHFPPWSGVGLLVGRGSVRSPHECGPDPAMTPLWFACIDFPIMCYHPPLGLKITIHNTIQYGRKQCLIQPIQIHIKTIAINQSEYS